MAQYESYGNAWYYHGYTDIFICRIFASPVLYPPYFKVATFNEL